MSLINTYRQEIRTKLPDNLERDEWRFTRYGLLTTAQEMTKSADSIVSQDLKQKAIASQGTALKVPVYSLGEVVVGNARTCAIGDLDNTTELVTVNWVTLTADMSMKPAEYAKNEVGYLEDFNKKIKNIDNSLALAVEALVYAELEAKKSTVHNSSLVGVGNPYPLVGDALQVAAAQQDTFFNDLNVIMEEDDFYSNTYKIVGSTPLKSPVMHYINQGGGNNENLTYQFDGMDFRFTNHLPTTAGSIASGFAMTDGSIGILSRNGDDFINGRSTGDGTVWTTEFLPTLGMEVGVMEKSNCADLSGQAGLEHLTATALEKWQFSIDIAIITPYNSDPGTKAGVIKKFDFLQ